MPSLVLTPRQTEDSQRLWRAAILRGWAVHRLTTWRIDDTARALDEPFLYAEALFGPTLADELGVRLLNPPEDWLCRLPREYRRRDIQLTTLEQARAAASPSFVKPPNDKSFPAAVYSASDLPAGFDPAMPVLVSEPVSFLSEFRSFIVHRRVVTQSIYAREGEPFSGEVEPAELSAMNAFLSALLQDDAVDLPDACVLDCGPIHGRGWAAVELNAAWGAGLYDCDAEAALEAVRAATLHV
ncbi:MAG: ATP-grasp domain-containing protein [Polyangiaceae bacterium]